MPNNWNGQIRRKRLRTAEKTELEWKLNIHDDRGYLPQLPWPFTSVTRPASRWSSKSGRPSLSWSRIFMRIRESIKHKEWNFWCTNKYQKRLTGKVLPSPSSKSMYPNLKFSTFQNRKQIIRRIKRRKSGNCSQIVDSSQPCVLWRNISCGLFWIPSSPPLQSSRKPRWARGWRFSLSACCASPPEPCCFPKAHVCGFV